MPSTSQHQQQYVYSNPDYQQFEPSTSHKPPTKIQLKQKPKQELPKDLPQRPQHELQRPHPQPPRRGIVGSRIDKSHVLYQHDPTQKRELSVKEVIQSQLQMRNIPSSSSSPHAASPSVPLSITASANYRPKTYMQSQRSQIPPRAQSTLKRRLESSMDSSEVDDKRQRTSDSQSQR